MYETGLRTCIENMHKFFSTSRNGLRAVYRDRPPGIDNDRAHNERSYIMSEAMMKSENSGAAMTVSDVMNTGLGYTDMNLSDRSAAVAFYNATSNPANKLKEHVNEVLSLVHVSVECVEVSKDDVPEGKTIAPRIVLITADGQSYSCVSVGVYQSLKRMFTLLGNPDTWTEPVQIKPVLISTKKGQVLSLNLV